MKIYTLCQTLGKSSTKNDALNPNYSNGEFLLVWDEEKRCYDAINDED